ncbi:MAG: nucleotide 5'-monophosphate nucleosidase PpnN [Cellvibrionales bacterium]|nr:nucleotide 5'-monophosphate nucleosidase PpnN [Cellvibrionales bacterium]
MKTLIDADVSPGSQLKTLSKQEITQLLDSSQGGLYQLFRRCSLAVLNCDNPIDDIEELESLHKSFDISLNSTERGVKLSLQNAPISAFVDGEIIKGICEHLFVVLRDIIYAKNEILESTKFNLSESEGITNAIFHILRNANAFRMGHKPSMVVCWGGHAISHVEYIYTKKVGYELGLRGLDICTGCGPGAMKGPMKGATIGHAKQRLADGRYLGVTEPGIIAAESPNAIVNELVILPDIEKRLEAFLRLGHAIIVFPGGVGTMEEILFVLGLFLHQENEDLPYPLILTGPESSRAYFEAIDAFILETLGEKAQSFYQIIIDDPAKVAYEIKKGIAKVTDFRRSTGDAFYYNWRLMIPLDFQTPFIPTHSTIKNELRLNKSLPSDKLACDLRKMFSAIVSGNVKLDTIKIIEREGPFEIQGDPAIMAAIDKVLQIFIDQGRMKLPGKQYVPCYRIVG